MKRFQIPYIFFWSIPVLIWGLIYGFITLYCFHATEEFYAYVEKSAYDTLKQNIRELAFFCIFLYVSLICSTFELVTPFCVFQEKKESSGVIYYKPAIGLFTIFSMMIITFGTMAVCGVIIARTLKKTTMSKKSVQMQKQLLKALTTQVGYVKIVENVI